MFAEDGKQKRHIPFDIVLKRMLPFPFTFNESSIGGTKQPYRPFALADKEHAPGVRNNMNSQSSGHVKRFVDG